MGIRTRLRERTRRTREHVCIGTAEVLATSQVTQRVRRVRLDASGLGAAAPQLPADAYKLFLPPPGSRTATLPTFGSDGMPRYDEDAPRPEARAFTVRHYDPEARVLDLDVVLHDGTRATAWVDAVRPGDRVDLGGPRHEFDGSSEVDGHVLIGDDTALPAIAAILESLGAGARVDVLVEVEDAEEEITLDTAADARVTWLHRHGAGTVELLPAAVRSLELDWGDQQVWVAGEAGQVRDIRRYLRDECGVDPENLQAAGYWRRGMTNADVDQVLAERYEQDLARGRTLDDIGRIDIADLLGDRS